MWTSVTRLAASAVSAGCGMSVGLSSVTPRASIRVTSTATLPTPMTTADRAPTTKPSAVASGCALYQDTNSVADQLPGRSSPGMPSRMVGRGAHAVHDGVVQLAQPRGRHAVRADPDTAEEPHPVVLQDRAQVVLERLDLLVVRCHPVAHQTVGTGQPVQDVDEHVGVLLDEALGGVAPAGPGADDGDTQHGGTPYERSR